MSPKKLRLLATCIEQGPIPEDDRRRWANDLRGWAKQMERDAAQARNELMINTSACQHDYDAQGQCVRGCGIPETVDAKHWLAQHATKRIAEFEAEVLRLQQRLDAAMIELLGVHGG